MDLANIPRRNYLTDPTPLDPMQNIEKELDTEIKLFIKRDDLLPGAFGGNKTRKLEFAIADALSKGSDAIITTGAFQSNHVRLTLSWCAKEQVECHLVLEDCADGSYDDKTSGNYVLFRLLGAASITEVPHGTSLVPEMRQLADKLKSQGKKPYLIPVGASNAVGALGYVAMVQELLDQCSQMDIKPDYIVAPSASGGTHAGLLLGLNEINSSIEVTGINLSKSTEKQTNLIKSIIADSIKQFGFTQVPDDRIICNEQYLGGGYAIPTQAMFDALKLFAGKEGILLDPVYSGKTASGLIDLVKTGYFKKGSTVIFLHTGGAPGLYAYQKTLSQKF